jgi:hypothetical protein
MTQREQRLFDTIAAAIVGSALLIAAALAFAA